jgi:hypothetical protein
VVRLATCLGQEALHPNTQVILAEDEEVLSIESQKEYCRNWEIEPVLVKDTHRLGGNLEIIKKAAIKVCATSGVGRSPAD